MKITINILNQDGTPFVPAEKPIFNTVNFEVKEKELNLDNFIFQLEAQLKRIFLDTTAEPWILTVAGIYEGENIIAGDEPVPYEWLKQQPNPSKMVVDFSRHRCKDKEHICL